MAKDSYLLASESVTEGHPDKVCDQISDAVLDSVLKQDPEKGRVACETYITMGLVIVGGEITTRGYVDIQKLCRKLLTERIGYTHQKYGFDGNTCSILNAIHGQSPDIARGVNKKDKKKLGAGDQGLMFGYACRETPQLMPIPIMLAHGLVRRMTEVRKKGTLKYLGPDGKSQVSIEYQNGEPKRVRTLILACQHTEDVVDKKTDRISKKARKEIIDVIARPVLEKYLDKETKFFVNETGKFLIGGPQSDTGMTGRKIIVDTYGGAVRHGGGAFSGKDPTKVDRSASYMSRYVAKNIVASGLADKCLIQLSYVIGRPEPLSIMVNTYGTGRVSDDKMISVIRNNFELTPAGIINELDLLDASDNRYLKTAAYGHFGREEKGFTWEKTDRVKDLAKYLK
ncbi:MAG: methionine adenosyltransferase [Candidatus Omnitrophica bacterium]|nr:methionine adenosyltransferase [Candidatus Omnitrophota bacterium]